MLKFFNTFTLLVQELFLKNWNKIQTLAQIARWKGVTSLIYVIISVRYLSFNVALYFQLKKLVLFNLIFRKSGPASTEKSPLSM
jgi:hypothetical protein